MVFTSKRFRLIISRNIWTKDWRNTIDLISHKSFLLQLKMRRWNECLCCPPTLWLIMKRELLLCKQITFLLNKEIAIINSVMQCATKGQGRVLRVMEINNKGGSLKYKNNFYFFIKSIFIFHILYFDNSFPPLFPNPIHILSHPDI